MNQMKKNGISPFLQSFILLVINSYNVGINIKKIVNSSSVLYIYNM